MPVDDSAISNAQDSHSADLLHQSKLILKPSETLRMDVMQFLLLSLLIFDILAQYFKCFYFKHREFKEKSFQNVGNSFAVEVM